MSDSDSKDFIDVLVHDHEEVKELFQRIETSTDATVRREAADQVTAELVRHSVAEEMYLYPAARDCLPDGDSMADDEIEEHAKAEALLKEFEGKDGDDPEFQRIFTQMSGAVLQHIAEEEGELFPRLREHMSLEERQKLGEKIEQAKKTAPTRPHPSAPDKPPFNKMLGPGAGLVDRIRDKLSGRKTD